MFSIPLIKDALCSPLNGFHNHFRKLSSVRKLKPILRWSYRFLSLLDAQESFKESLFIMVTMPLILLIRYIWARF